MLRHHTARPLLLEAQKIRVTGVLLDVGDNERADWEHLHSTSSNVVEHMCDETGANSASFVRSIYLCVQDREKAGLCVVIEEAGELRAEVGLVAVRLGVVDDAKLVFRSDPRRNCSRALCVRRWRSLGGWWWYHPTPRQRGWASLSRRNQLTCKMRRSRAAEPDPATHAGRTLNRWHALRSCS